MVDLETLRATQFGAWVAENELDLLGNYFVETAQWQGILAGNVDVIYGPKGAGKSALYSLLIKSAALLRERGIVVVNAENPRGAPAFEYLDEDPPSTERDFISMWKLYFASLVAEAIYENGNRSGALGRVLSQLEDAGLRRGGLSLRVVLRNVSQYIKSLTRVESIEASETVDAGTGVPVLTQKITIREPNSAESHAGKVSIDSLLDTLEQSLAETGLSAWILLDRLDVAFNDNEALEENALRALFRAYRDLSDKPHLGLKIFLRSDIWQRITSQGFREASHITKTTNITWDKAGLVNLVIRRALANAALCKHYGANREEILESYSTQEAFFDRLFPPQIDLGERKPSTIDWMLTRVQDGTAQPAPRELIHLLNASLAVQIRKAERGESSDDGDVLLSRAALKEGLAEVSKVRLEQTIYAEYPNLKPFIELLREEKTAQSLESLAKLWNLGPEEAGAVASKLVKIGFFEAREPKTDPEFWVPFLYRSALDMVQGTAD